MDSALLSLLGAFLLSMLGLFAFIWSLRKGLLVAGIVRRNGQTVIPSGNDALQEGDDVVIVTTDTTLHSLRDIVK